MLQRWLLADGNLNRIGYFDLNATLPMKSLALTVRMRNAGIIIHPTQPLPCDGSLESLQLYPVTTKPALRSMSVFNLEILSVASRVIVSGQCFTFLWKPSDGTFMRNITYNCRAIHSELVLFYTEIYYFLNPCVYYVLVPQYMCQID